MKVEIQRDEIVVTKPGTSCMLAYAKPRRNSLLFVKRSWVTADATSPAISEFRAQAFRAALRKRAISVGLCVRPSLSELAVGHATTRAFHTGETLQADVEPERAEGNFVGGRLPPLFLRATHVR
jgi:hypothetical protein